MCGYRRKFWKMWIFWKSESQLSWVARDHCNALLSSFKCVFFLQVLPVGILCLLTLKLMSSSLVSSLCYFVHEFDWHPVGDQDLKFEASWKRELQATVTSCKVFNASIVTHLSWSLFTTSSWFCSDRKRLLSSKKKLLTENNQNTSALSYLP